MDKYEVLVDLKFAVLGYSGIPQDTRLLFRTFALEERLSPSGLIWGMNDQVALQDFPKRKKVSQTFLDSAQFLLAVLGDNPVSARTKAGKFYVRAKLSLW